MKFHKPHTILIITLSGIGDALMFSPALRILKQNFPYASIDMLCMFRGVEELFQRNIDIRTIYRWDFIKSSFLSSFHFILKLRKNYDVSISVYPANRWEYNVINFLLGAPIRLGHEYNHLNFVSLYFLNNRRIREDEHRHNVEENVKLVETLNGIVPSKPGPLAVNLTQSDHSNALAWLRENDISETSTLIGFHAGSAEFKNHVKRRWSPERYSSLGDLLIQKYDATILLFGGSDELALNEKINAGMRNKGNIVQTSLMTTAALIKRCNVFICNDTGLMHLAAGIQVPIVTIFAFTNPSYVYPWKAHYEMVRHDLPCSPCFYYSPRHARCKWKEDQFRCITHIEVNEVQIAVEKILAT